MSEPANMSSINKVLCAEFYISSLQPPVCKQWITAASLEWSIVRCLVFCQKHWKIAQECVQACCRCLWSLCVTLQHRLVLEFIYFFLPSSCSWETLSAHPESRVLYLLWAIFLHSSQTVNDSNLFDWQCTRSWHGRVVGGGGASTTARIKMHLSSLRCGQGLAVSVIVALLCFVIVTEWKSIRAGRRLGKLAGRCQYESADFVCTLDTSAFLPVSGWMMGILEFHWLLLAERRYFYFPGQQLNTIQGVKELNWNDKNHFSRRRR